MTPRKCPTCLGTHHDAVFVKDSHALVRCSECGLVFVRNLPTPEDLSSLYDSESYHEDSERVIKSFTERAAAQADLLQRHCPVPGRILDVGCSHGYFLRNAREGGWSTAGVELSRRSAEVARTVRGLDVVTGTLDDAPWPPGSFDVVTMWDVIEHLPSPGEVLLQVTKLLKPGGALLLATPAVDGLYPRISLRLTRVTGWWGHPEPPYHLQQYGKKTITDLCERNGFAVTTIEDDHIPLGYSFGLSRSVKRNLASALLLPLAAIGPHVRMGDSMYVVATKVPTPN